MKIATNLLLLAVFTLGSAAMLRGQQPDADDRSADLLPTGSSAGASIPLLSPIGPDDGDADFYDGYFWYSPVLRRGDTNRQDFTVPLRLSDGTEVRGLGQVFNPFYLYDFYRDVYTEQSGILPLDSGVTDADYIASFAAPILYVVDSIFIYPYKYILSDPVHSAYVDVFRTEYDFNSDGYRQKGFVEERGRLELLAELEMTPEMLDRTVGESTQADSFKVVETKMVFDPPLELDRKQSLAIMFINDDAPALNFTSLNNFSQAQQVIGFAEYRRGEPEYFSAPIDSFRCLGLVMERRNGVDTISSLWRKRIALANGTTVPSNATTLIAVYGHAGYISGLRHHFGGELRSEGIRSLRPTPASTTATIEFSLGWASHLGLGLFTLDGREIRELERGGFPAGNYSMDIDLADLQDGIYFVRLTVGEKITTEKLIVRR